MNTDEAQHDRIEKVIREIHEYARHTMQLFVAFFTFFVLMNYTTMGFLAKDLSQISKEIVSRIAWTFIFQNSLAIVSCVLVAVYLRRADLDHQKALAAHPVPPLSVSASVLPKHLYLGILVLSGLTFAVMVRVWCLFLR
jgi:uncharacterized membrane protein (DUF485 family)